MEKHERERLLVVAKTVEGQAKRLVETHPGRVVEWVWSNKEGNLVENKNEEFREFSELDVLAIDTAMSLREIASALRLIAESASK